MADLRLEFDAATLTADLAMGADPANRTLADDGGLHTAILLSLFCDRRAAEDDEIPAGDGDRRGWWADQFGEIDGDEFGSKLWLLDRSKLSARTVERAKRYAEDALRWLVEDGVAKSVTVTAEAVPTESRIEIGVTVIRPSGVEERFAFAWSGADAS